MFNSGFSSAQKLAYIALYPLALLAGSKLAVTATIKMAAAQIGPDADLQPIKPNVLLHVAPVMKDFTVPQCKTIIRASEVFFVFYFCSSTH